MPTVTLSNGRSFHADTGISILEAANAAGVTLEYSCRTGRCGICKAPLLAGKTTIVRSEDESLTKNEALDGLILTCCRAAESDVSLDVESLDRLNGIEIRTMPARIVSIEPLAEDIVRIVLKTPPTTPLRFVAGQYIDVIADGVRRSYSLANAPRADGLLELIIKRYTGGHLSAFWFERAKPNDLIRLEGPFGTFFRRDAEPANILFLATGTGIAPVKALLEEMSANREAGFFPCVRLFWGNRKAESFIWNPASLGLDIDFHRLLSGADPDWNGRKGHIHKAAIEDGVDPANTIVYACGSSAMIASARDALIALGLPMRRFLSDAFVSSN